MNISGKRRDFPHKEIENMAENNKIITNSPIITVENMKVSTITPNIDCEINQTSTECPTSLKRKFTHSIGDELVVKKFKIDKSTHSNGEHSFNKSSLNVYKNTSY